MLLLCVSISEKPLISLSPNVTLTSSGSYTRLLSFANVLSPFLFNPTKLARLSKSSPVAIARSLGLKCALFTLQYLPTLVRKASSVSITNSSLGITSNDSNCDSQQ